MVNYGTHLRYLIDQTNIGEGGQVLLEDDGARRRLLA